MRSFWKGTIGFGMVTIPVKAYSATEERSFGLHQLHAADGGRIKMKRVCEIDGAEVPSAELAKGLETPAGDVVVLTDEDFAKLPLSTERSIDVHAFAPLEQIDPIYFAKSYYLEPDTGGTKPYVLFAEALAQSGRVAVVKVALRQRETVGVLRVRDHVIVMETMLWPDEIRTPDFPFLDEDVDVRLPELRAAAALIERMAGDFVPMQHTDRYRDALEALVEAKLSGRDVISPPVAVKPEGSIDLLSALRASVAAAEPGTTSTRRAAVSRAKAAANAAAEAKAAAKKAASKVRSTAKPRR